MNESKEESTQKVREGPLARTLLNWLVRFPPIFSLFPVCSIDLMYCVLFPHFLTSCMHLSLT